MTPRDLSRRTALVVGANAVEIMDIEEHLVLRGWGAPVVVDTFSDAVRALDDLQLSVDLVVLTLPQGGNGAAEFVYICMSAEIAMIVVNGGTATTQAGQVVTLSRPFVDADLDQAMHTLGLATA